MIQALRKKFVLINMLLVLIVLLIVFSALYVSNFRRLENDSFNAMRRVLQEHIGPQLPEKNGEMRPFPMTSVFCVQLRADGTVEEVTRENLDITEKDAVQAAEQALATGKSTGVLNGPNFRFLRQDTESGIKLAFADLSNERATLGVLLRTSALVGLGGLAAFFLVSLFLSNWALRPVERAWEQQQRFVADASHELKTPLTVILANTDILLSHRKDRVEDQRKWVENTRTETLRMKGLVDDLLFLARADAAKTPQVCGSVHLSDAVLSCVLTFESVAFERQVTLEQDIQPDLYVQGDQAQLRQLVGILLDNACKYAGPGGSVALRLERQQERVRLSVHNTGKPIPREEQEHLFERFYRAEKSRAREEGGYGLGLAIAKSIVESHKGKITVESGVEGVTFFVFLPAGRLAGT